MRDMMNIMKKVKEMQTKMQQMQSELANLKATGIAGGGLVNITINGQNTISEIKIDPSLMNPKDVEILEDLVIAAYNDAKSKLDVIIKEKTNNVTAGMPIPPGFQFPFL
ncbi:YbaB/EbfC family nucleoid-associated protein [Bartonella bilalgolemii]|uniref:Nucleoid-associated protein M4Z11_04985 n=1 Tax=Bartonella bilalgolemii TaxID=2942911 RepID=A0ABT0P9P4_9HYPH|nr:YbaB/EbfC family nucleoid-associated protein [Bartonella sp. G70]MCL6229952.1 YbaB/EbfC family nucleoid-associated protein [Bartonella sp. G70]